MTYRKLTLLAQGVAAMILLMAAAMKFMADPDSVAIFARLGMEPAGRHIIAVLEITAALLLLSPFAALGSVLSVGIMCGAIIAHVTQLGLVVNGDGGRQVGMLTIAMVCSAIVLVSRRREIPLVGGTL